MEPNKQPWAYQPSTNPLYHTKIYKKLKLLLFIALFKTIFIYINLLAKSNIQLNIFQVQFFFLQILISNLNYSEAVEGKKDWWC